MRVAVIFIVFLFLACANEKKVAETKTAQQETKTTQEVVKKKNHTIDYITGKFEPQHHEDFVLIPEQYADRGGLHMHRDAFNAFVAMYDAALKEGIELEIKSAARNFTYQKRIWENKWTGRQLLSDGTNVSKDIEKDVDKALKILEYSSMPGSSRHHWGTDIDLNSFNNKWFESGEGLKLYTWMQENGMKYGFCQVYCEKGQHRADGYNEEKWHYSYMPESQGLLTYAKDHLKVENIRGFTGDHTAAQVDIINKYILGIDQRCHH